MKILITGAAGFIGSRIASLLAQRGDEVVGIDNINDYYDVRLKYARLCRLLGVGKGNEELAWYPSKTYQSSIYPNLRFMRMGIEDKPVLDALFEQERFDKVINLAAQAGVRYSITNPYAYMTSNMEGFLNILEACRQFPVKHLLFASSSSVYGLNSKAPFSEGDKVDMPVSLYAASKKSNELMAHSYSKLYDIPATGVRYFTVYGPWGRPDMAPMLFSNAISQGLPINVFNNGDMVRDFTYIDDIANGSIRILDTPPVANECDNGVAYRIYNIGCAHPVKLMDFILEIEIGLGKKAQMVMKPMQPGDVYMTNADVSKLKKEIGYEPQFNLHEGMKRFMEWFQSDDNVLRQ